MFFSPFVNRNTLLRPDCSWVSRLLLLVVVGFILSMVSSRFLLLCTIMKVLYDIKSRLFTNYKKSMLWRAHTFEYSTFQNFSSIILSFFLPILYYKMYDSNEFLIV